MSADTPGAGEPSAESSGGGTHVLERGLAVLSTLARARRPMGLVEVARETGLSKSTVHRYATSLQGMGFVEQDAETRKYRLGPAAMTLGVAAVGSLEVSRVGGPTLQALADETNHTASLAILDGADIIYVDRRRPARAGFRIELNVQVGTRLPAYCTSMGKVLLAHRDPATVRAILDRVDLVRRGPGTITAREQLVAALAEVRATGLAINDEELASGLRSLAVPVRDHTGTVVAAVGTAVHLSGWNATLDAVVARLEPALRRSAGEISQRLGWLG